MEGYSIAFPDDRRFDDRSLRHNDATDFEDFVRDCLNAEVGGMVLSRRLARGRDGAIDLLSEADGNTWVVECKFQARDTTTEPERRWAEVAEKLTKHLPALAADPEKGVGSPYRRWLDREQPVGRYTFCVAAPMTRPKADGLCGTIRTFSGGFAGNPALAHLAGIEVEVLSWDRFHAIAGNHPALRFHWFGGLPPGIQPLEAAPGTEPSFRDFLSTLPYFSRQDFLAERAGAKVETEEALLDRFADDRAHAALVVSGPGGVGKTRLALELGRGLRGRGWLVVRVDRQAPAASVEALIRTHRAAGRIVFLLDYAEAAAQLDGIAAAVLQGAADAGHCLRLIATCRASGQRPVEDGLVDLEPQVHTVAGPVGDETTFADWVIGRILAQGNLPDQEGLAAVCNGLPALAAFAVFLHRHRRESFDAQFRDLVGLTGFKSWATRRIALLTRDAPAADVDQQALADLALGLPMPVAARDALADAGGRPGVLLGRLEDDRWVESDGGLLAAAHDVLADALAAHWLLATEVAATRRVSDALRRAADGGRLDPALTAIDRLAAHPVFGAIDGLAAVRGLRESRPEATLAALPALLRGRLLTPEAKLALLAEAPELRERARVDRALDGPISLLAEHAARAAPDAPARAHAANLVELLDVAVAHPHPPNMVLRRAYALLSDRYRQRVLARIGAEPTSSQTHYLLVAMLRAGEPPADLAQAVATWLRSNSHWNAKASFVLKAWLDAHGDPELVEADVRAWLDAHRVAPEADFVLKAWLDAHGDPGLVEADARAWLDAHRVTPEARFVLKAWLDAHGDRELVRAHVVAWLAMHGFEDGADFVGRAWLQSGGDPESIRDWACAWVAKNWAEQDAVFLMKEVSKLNDLPDEYLIAIACWCEKYSSDPDAVFRLSRIARYLLREETSDAARAQVMRAGLLLCDAVCRRGVPKEKQARFAVGVIVTQLILAAGSNPELSVLTDSVLARLIAGKGVFLPRSGLQSDPRLVLVFRRVVEAGFLDIERHAPGIEAFVGWLREQEDPDGMIAAFLLRMGQAFPSPVWD